MALSKSQQFFKQWMEKVNKKGNSNKSLSLDKYNEIVAKLKVAIAKTGSKTDEEYQLMRRFDMVAANGVQKLIKKRKKDDDNFRYYVANEDIYDRILGAHIDLGHGGINKMKKELNPKYANITQDAITLFISLCEECEVRKVKKNTKSLVHKPIRSNEFWSRAQVDLIDMQSEPDGEYKWILNCQDHFTKFNHLRPLKTKTGKEVAEVLVDIFLKYNGAPTLLQMDNGLEFRNAFVYALKNEWPGLQIAHGRPRYPQSQGSVEKSNDEVKKLLVTWTRTHKSTNWAHGLKYVQFRKNRSHHSGIGMTACMAYLVKQCPSV